VDRAIVFHPKVDARFLKGLAPVLPFIRALLVVVEVIYVLHNPLLTKSDTLVPLARPARKL